MPLSPGDDFLIHQYPEPIDTVYTGDRHFYDRYYFNMHGSDDSLFMVFGMGQYPNLSLIHISAGPSGRGPAPVAWDEAREVVALGLTLCSALMALAPIVNRLIDGQLDRWAWNGTLASSTQPVVAFAVLGAALLVATTPAADVTPTTRRVVAFVANAIVVLAVILILDILFGPTAGGVREFFRRFPTALRRCV